MEMLTEQELGALRRLARDNTPMRPVNGNPVPRTETASVSEHLDREVARARKMAPANPDEDWDLIYRIDHTMRKGEKVMEWFARVGLSRPQVFAMSKAEVKRHADLADERNAQEPRHIQLLAQPEPQKLWRFAFTD